jgi:glycogen operon protein
MQWNGSYRDCVQRFVRGDGGMVSELMTRIYGSSDLFPDDLMHSMRPFQSVNYLTSHDGFTLFDLVSFNRKRNWANGFNNQDGHDDFSWNCGWEGNQDVPEFVRRLRFRQAKNLFCLLMLSNGTPMFRMGDEFLNSQQGNSNPYNQDNEVSWLNWKDLKTNREMFRFAREMIGFRKSHPSICRFTFWRDDVRWYGAGHDADFGMDSRTLAYCLHGQSHDDDDLYVMINADATDLKFGIFEGTAGQWQRIVDTALEPPDDISEGAGPTVNDSHYHVQSRSVVILTRVSG